MAVIADDASTEAAQEILSKAVAAPVWHGEPTWLHGDLHPANVIVRDGTLAGVIDFGLRAVGLISIGRNGRLGLPGGKPTWEPAGRAALERALAVN